MRILYVEDDESIREGMSRILERRFENIIYAKNGAEGLEKFKEYMPDLVITDIQMPFMTGLEMSKAIKEIRRDVPIVVTTAFSEGHYLQEALDIGIDRYLNKPIVKQELLTVLSEMQELYQDTMKVN